MRIRFFIAIFIYIFSFVSNASEPKISEDKVIFANGSIIYLTDLGRLGSDSAPLDSEKVTVKLIKNWKVVALLTNEQGDEGTSQSLTLFNYDGEQLIPEFRFLGEIKFALKKRLLIMFGSSEHFEVDSSFLFFLDGLNFVKVTHGEAFELGIAKDEEIFWLFKALVKEGEPVIEVIVYDSSGTFLSSHYIQSQKILVISNEGKDYKINVPIPKFPG